MAKRIAKREDPAMVVVRRLVKKAGLTQQQLGEGMGYPKASARKSVWQFMKTSDPSISTLRRFAKAMGVKVADLIGDD